MAEANSYPSYYHEPEVVKESIFKGSEALQKAPEIVGVPTGIEGLDDLFFTLKEEKGKLKQVPLGGIPKYSVFNLTGVNDTGKSLMAEQFAVEQARKGEKVAFITVETPANFVISSIKYRALAMGYKFEDFEDNIILIDAASHSKLRENIPDLLATLAYAIKEFKINYTVIDSVTGLFENKEMMARAIVRRVYNFLKKWYQTAILISQKRSGHEELSSEAAGGYAVGHIVDGTMVVAKELIVSQYAARMYKAKLGDLIRLFRIDGCRMSGHDTKTHFMEITETGLVRILGPLGE
ncbi:KaiC domain-containing protein [Nitratiruptor sp. SB155-2]|uniref:KaiC domain-containing protein n=1 Tax=Nitratiruptor sp. (strain SB155-2) TaxID=387092 RepID=UPI00015870CD|nr:KaiC domain-containing protein [Nitratiruptor sp. SB155-2]BAF70866.1 ATPase, RecA-superfamily [Nitratiruptor sp. SB155-2]